MKLKYYLRGLGIGILVAAAILTISRRSGNGGLTNEEVIARAQDLGMVMQDNSTLAQTALESQVAAETGVIITPIDKAEESKEP
ncbi:MAG: hypothetical protein IJ589_09335, partial [Lachnospiraceae bacterium]|nr:hypothetical protein [Lachnospiraceae bacterium]